jgi:hypothetical protein
VRSSVGGAGTGTASEENWVVATGDARLGDRFDDVLLDADSDEPDDFPFFRRAGRGGAGTAWCAAGCCEMQWWLYDCTDWTPAPNPSSQVRKLQEEQGKTQKHSSSLQSIKLHFRSLYVLSLIHALLSRRDKADGDIGHRNPYCTHAS